MTRTLLLIAAAALLPAPLQAENRTPASITRGNAEIRAGNFQLVSNYCIEGLCERVYERTVQPVRRSRSAPQRYIVRIEPDTKSRQMALADR